MQEVSDQTDFERFACPGCGEEVDVALASSGRLVRCPYCSSDFFAAADKSHLEIVDDTDSELLEADRASAFDKLRIANYTALRMSAIRARSWWLIGLFLALLVMLDMLGNTLIYIWVFHRWGIWPTVRIGLYIVALVFARHAYRRAADFKREIDRSALPEPTTPPDFSTLQDGTEQWKHLENIR